MKLYEIAPRKKVTCAADLVEGEINRGTYYLNYLRRQREKSYGKFKFLFRKTRIIIKNEKEVLVSDDETKSKGRRCLCS